MVSENCAGLTNLSNVVQLNSDMGDDTKKKETKTEKKDEFGDVVEEKKTEEEVKEED
ncbi:hypothetical protein BH18THE1_BH18THE1_13390 [soil metagenome]